ncbi:hypothetical protein AAFN85_09565 [Mucilaginibacter sp. CAU 1740]|uniref:hypothetical protein n=1 Tax=Mucilaginibacter sp. CAU 1740 TaxID=3140365 RepID=UPI00325AE4A2
MKSAKLKSLMLEKKNNLEQNLNNSEEMVVLNEEKLSHLQGGNSAPSKCDQNSCGIKSVDCGQNDCTLNF